ncbi:MAG TPA: peptide chain release factor N(5)-glutamine methyltransferase [Micropepsaceae bacterium]|nr:peptide chain release factor N(5)-glutamine methyltransferase [Micropepsaceae bacterium]
MKILDSAVLRLRGAGIESPRLEARLILAHVLGLNQEDIIAGNCALDTQTRERFEAGLARRIAREPLSYILGKREFWSLDFTVGPGVLVPRPESETLVEAALSRLRGRDDPFDVLDLGTGSGCLLLAFLSERPRAKGVGLDISEEALRFAEENSQRLGMKERVELVHGDWSAAPERRFDVIFANPPYIAESAIGALDADVSAYEPRLALSGGVDGLEAYRRIAQVIPGRLKGHGLAFVELGEGQLEAVTGLFQNAGLEVNGTFYDLASIPRCLVARGAQCAGLEPKKALEMESGSG